MNTSHHADGSRWRAPSHLALVLGALLTALGHPAAAQPRPTAALARSGWQAIRTGRIADAATAFRQALAAAPRDATLLLGAGLAAHLAGKAAEARQHLEQALEVNPRLTDASLLLGQIAHRQGDLHSAIRTYEDALAAAPGHPVLEERLARWRQDATLHGALDRQVSDHFTILFEGAADQALAARALEALERAYWRLAAILGTSPVAPIQVVLYPEQQFHDITRAPTWSAGAFDGTIRVPVRDALANGAELDRVLSHEVTHAFVWSIAARGVPKWLDEGLAVVFEAEGSAPSPARGSSPAHDASPAALPDSFASLNGLAAADAYRRSGSAASVLLDLIGGAGVASLLADLGAGTDLAEAFAYRTSYTYTEFQRRWPELADVSREAR